MELEIFTVYFSCVYILNGLDRTWQHLSPKLLLVHLIFRSLHNKYQRPVKKEEQSDYSDAKEIMQELVVGHVKTCTAKVLKGSITLGNG